MKMSEKLQEIKKDNKGFSLVELIIVIAIMAILIGIVGMNVIPQIENANKATDAQVLSALVSEAMEAWTQAAQASEDIVLPVSISGDTITINATYAGDGVTDASGKGQATLNKFRELENMTGSTTDSSRKVKSKAGKGTTNAGTATPPNIQIHCTVKYGVYIGTIDESTGKYTAPDGFTDYEFRSR